MDIVLLVIIYVAINIFFLRLCKIYKEKMIYDTIFCKDIRANLGMFAYKLELEEKRQKLNKKNSKF